MRIIRRRIKSKMKDTIGLLYFFTILYIHIIHKSFAAPSPVPDSSFVFPGPSTSDDYNPSGRSFPNDYDPSSSIPSYNDNLERRHLYDYKRRYPRPYLSTGHGCRGHSCDYEGYGSRQNYGGYYPQNQPTGNSFASASAGSIGQSNQLGGNRITSQANSQSATFNFGPFSASFSSAHAISGPNGLSNFNYG